MRQRIVYPILLAAALGGMIPISAESATPFLGLGPTPDGYPSIPAAISGDGTTVVGLGNHVPVSSWFRWTVTGGFETLSFSPHEVSADGSLVVGVSGNQAVLWTSTGGMTGLGYIPGGHLVSTAYGVSADGTIVVGFGEDLYGDVAFRWTSSGGMQTIGVPSGTQSRAWDISADGLVIVGKRGGFNSEAFRWTANDGVVGLGDLPGGPSRSEANATSADGSVVVGYGTPASNFPVAFRWTSADGMVPLGVLTGVQGSRALSVSGDGSVVVGESVVGGGPAGAWVWTKAGGMQPLADVLTGGGADLTGWTLTEAADISADGRQVTGYGTHLGISEGFIATLPTADWDSDSIADAADNCILTANPDQYDSDGDGFGNICDADLNNSGLTTSADFNLQRSCLNLPSTTSALCADADMNGSGMVTAADFNLLRAKINTAPGPSGLHP